MCLVRCGGVEAMTKGTRKRINTKTLTADRSTTRNYEAKENSRVGSNATTRMLIFASVLVAFVSIGAADWMDIIGYRYLERLVEKYFVIEPTDDEKIGQFLAWFQENGGWLSTHVEVAAFTGYGFGLEAVGPKIEYAVDKGDQLLIIPKSIQFSVESTILRFRQLDPSAEAIISDAVSQHYQSSPLESQDAMLALSLMVECSLGMHSNFCPYLSILPDFVPRLDTFEDVELDMLHDPSLKALAKQSLWALQSYFSSVQSALRDLVKAAAIEAQSEPDISCLSFESFHRFVSIASSHAMILDNIKHIAPMADMINHAPRTTMTDDGDNDSFASHHVRNTETGEITVLADRFVKDKQQIFEEYGKLDNSLYLLAHGFVPDDNPHHCVILPPSMLPGISRPELLFAIKELNIPSPVVDGVCVQGDGALSKHFDAYLALSALEHDISRSKQLQECENALKSKIPERMQAECMKYPGHGDAVALALQKSAAAAIVNSPTTVAQDLELLNEYSETKEREQLLLALRFRIADKKVLLAISGGVDMSGPE